MLAILITYSATVEAAHRHGRILSSESGSTCVTQPDDSTKAGTSKADCSDCLICQLHQNFSATEIVSRIANTPPLLRGKAKAATVPILHSADGTTECGRAPPVTS